MKNHTHTTPSQKMLLCDGEIGYRQIVEYINDGVVILKNNKIIFANKAFYEICRKSPEEIQSSDFSELIAPQDRNAVNAFLRQKCIADSLPDRIEFTLNRPDEGGLMEMKVTIIQCADGPAILGAITDITERRKTRTALARLKDRLESILYSMKDVVVSFAPSDHSIVAINSSAEVFYGVPAREFLSGSRNIMEFVHPQDLESVKSFYRSIPEVEFAELSYRIISKNKSINWVLDEGHLVYGEKGRVRRIDHVIRDITEEKCALDALKQSEEKYRSFFESTNDMAYTVTLQGIFIDINDAGVKLLGFAGKKEAIGTNIQDAWAEPSQRMELLNELSERGFVEDRRTKFKNRNGKILEVAITARAKIDEKGNILYYEGLIHNITQAMEDQRNRVLRNAAGGLCHYLNTHLATLHLSKGSLAEDIDAIETLITGIDVEQMFSSEKLHRMKENLISLKDSLNGVDKAGRKISQVTNAFNSAFLTYVEAPYLDKTILDIFQNYAGNEKSVDS